MAGWWPGCCCGCTAATAPMIYGGSDSTGSALISGLHYSGGAWSSTGFPTTRLFFGSESDSCYVYGIGGQITSLTYVQTVDRFDKFALVYATTTAHPLNLQHDANDAYGHASEGLDVFFGYKSAGTNTAHHRLTAGTWSSLSASPGASVKGRCVNSCRAGTANLFGRAESTVTADSYWQYVESTDTSTSGTAMPAPRQSGASVTDLSDSVICCGGFNAGVWYDTTFILSDSGNSWSTGSTMSTKKIYHTGMSDVSTALVAGGTTNGNNTGSMTTAESYGFGGGSWSTITALPAKRYLSRGGA